MGKEPDCFHWSFLQAPLPLHPSSWPGLQEVKVSSISAGRPASRIRPYYLVCALWCLQQHNPHPERGVPSDTSFSMCVSVLESLSPRVQGPPPGAFREPPSSLPFWPRGPCPKGQSAGIRVPVCLVVTFRALLVPLPELSRSLPLFL